jgi:hypothetical protein
MFRVFACCKGSFALVGVTRSAAVALDYLLHGNYLVCDDTGGCYDADELSRLAAAA